MRHILFFLICLYGRIQEGRCCNGRREVSCDDKAVYEQGRYSYVPVPKAFDLEAYKDQLIERFSNKAISDQVSRLCGDGIAKFAVYVVPILKQMLQDGKDISIEAFLIAVYCKYLIGARTESGENIAISEPHITPADRTLISGGSSAEFLKISPFVSLGLDKYPVFMEKYEQFYAMQVAEGLKVLLQ